MTPTIAPSTEPPPTHPAPDPGPIDWERAIQLPAFRQLLRSRRRFVVPAATGAVAWISAWLVLVAYAHDFMGSEIAAGVSVMLVTGLSQFVLVWVLTFAYMRRSRLIWTTMQRRAIAELEALRAGESR